MLSTISIPKSATAFVGHLEKGLQDNLHSVVIYGSVVRGGYDPKTSDINLLIVLEASTPEAHLVISEGLPRTKAEIDPFVLTRTGIDRSFRAFATKFDSIKRHYEVLHGADPLADYQPDPALARFLCEQAVRNLRLRSVQAFIHWRRDGKRYMSYLERTIPVIITDLSEVLRSEDIEVPKDFDQRLPIIAREFGVEAGGLKNLFDIAHQPRPISAGEIQKLHRFVFTMLDSAVNRISGDILGRDIVGGDNV
jgi:hypothetical protein